MSRTPQEVFDSHKEALETGNFEMLAVDYADNASIPHGAAFFIIQDGLIQRQGEWFTIVPK